MTTPRPNRYEGQCVNCTNFVSSGAGFLTATGAGNWEVWCTSCYSKRHGSSGQQTTKGAALGVASLNLDLLIKLLNMTRSTTPDGEALAAMRKANLQLEKLGPTATWETLLRGKITILADPFSGPDNLPPMSKSPADSGFHSTPAPPPRQAAGYTVPPRAPPPPPPPPPRAKATCSHCAHTFDLSFGYSSQYCSYQCYHTATKPRPAAQRYQTAANRRYRGSPKQSAADLLKDVF